jgi:hypothetical protein
MNKSHLLRILVVANVLLAFASVGAEAFFGWTLPLELAQYERARHAIDFSNPVYVFRFLMIAVTSLFAFAAWIGLASFWRHARGLYLVSWALWLFFILVAGPRVQTSVGSMFSAMDALVAGTIVGLVYFSDLAGRFETAAAPETARRVTSLSADRT